MTTTATTTDGADLPVPDHWIGGAGAAGTSTGTSPVYESNNAGVAASTAAVSGAGDSTATWAGGGCGASCWAGAARAAEVRLRRGGAGAARYGTGGFGGAGNGGGGGGCGSGGGAGGSYVDERYRIGTVTYAGIDANAEQVRRGMAWVYDRYARQDSPLYALQDQARAIKAGLWRDAQPVPPWEWRRK